MTRPVPTDWLTVQIELLETDAKAEFNGQEQRIVAVLLQHNKAGTDSRIVYGIQDPDFPGRIIPVDFDGRFSGIRDPKNKRVTKAEIQEPNTYPIGKGYGGDSKVKQLKK